MLPECHTNLNINALTSNVCMDMLHNWIKMLEGVWVIGALKFPHFHILECPILNSLSLIQLKFQIFKISQQECQTCDFNPSLVWKPHDHDWNLAHIHTCSFTYSKV